MRDTEVSTVSSLPSQNIHARKLLKRDNKWLALLKLMYCCAFLTWFGNLYWMICPAMRGARIVWMTCTITWEATHAEKKCGVSMSGPPSV